MFVEQPAATVVAPFGGRVQLNCSVVQGYGIEWEIMFYETETRLSTGNTREVGLLRSRGIEVLPSSSLTNSYLVVDGTEENNQATVICNAFQENSVTECQSGESQVIFHGI